MGKIESYKDLIAWQRGMELVEQVYRITSTFPSQEKFGLTSQVRRAAVSIPANIAEGYGRRTRVDYVRFLDIARGSANEVETHLLLGLRLNFATGDDIAVALELINEVQKVLRGLAESLRRMS